MEFTEASALGAIAVLAGAMNAIAGGGTLLTFPALLAFGVPPVVANASNTLALFLGTAGSLVGYRRQLAAVRPWLWRLLPVSALGGWLGSVLLTRTDERLFAVLVPFLILFATLIFLLQEPLRRFAGFGAGVAPQSHPPALRAAVCLQLLVAVYGGYFGAGIGILMLASLSLLGTTDLHEMNAIKNVLASVINCVAALWFIWSGLIDWPRVAVLTAGALVGYFLGAHFAQQLPTRQVRRAVVAIGLAIAAAQFWQLLRP